jgi:ribosome modulation factor
LFTGVLLFNPTGHIALKNIAVTSVTGRYIPPDFVQRRKYVAGYRNAEYAEKLTMLGYPAGIRGRSESQD